MGGQGYFRLARGGRAKIFLKKFWGKSAVLSRVIFYEGSIGQDG